jgi:hypothetical protein
MTEGDVQNLIRIEGAKNGLMFWRNNSGVLKDTTGRAVRFGLGNDSKRVNMVSKSSDLIGIWKPYGIFVAVECKIEGWRYTGTVREVAQLNYIKLVRQYGGIACFATGWANVTKELEKWKSNSGFLPR